MEETGASGPFVQNSTTIIVVIILAALIIIAIIVDVSCYFINRSGLTYLICKKINKDESKGNKEALVEDGKEEHNSEKTPLKASQEEDSKPYDGDDRQVHHPMETNDDKKELIDGEQENGLKKTSSKSSVAKDSAV